MGFSLPCPAGAQSGWRVRGRSRTRRSPGPSTDTRPSTAAIARPGQARRIFFCKTPATTLRHAPDRRACVRFHSFNALARPSAGGAIAHRTRLKRGASPRQQSHSAPALRARSGPRGSRTRSWAGGVSGPARDAAERAPRGNARESKSREPRHRNCRAGTLGEPVQPRAHVGAGERRPRISMRAGGRAAKFSCGRALDSRPPSSATIARARSRSVSGCCGGHSFRRATSGATNCA